MRTRLNMTDVIWPRVVLHSLGLPGALTFESVALVVARPRDRRFDFPTWMGLLTRGFVAALAEDTVAKSQCMLIGGTSVANRGASGAEGFFPNLWVARVFADRTPARFQSQRVDAESKHPACAYTYRNTPGQQ